MSALDAPEWLGYDGFVWWFGRVEDNRDPKELGRVRVRVFGTHRMDYQLIPTDSLPWALVLMPATSASHGGVGQTVGLEPGSWVLGFFLDGARGQMPMVLGSIHGMHQNAFIAKSGAVSGPSSTTENGGATATGTTANIGNVGKSGGKFNQASNLGIPLGGGNLVQITTKNGADIKVSSVVSAQFQGFVNELEASGYVIKKGSSGGFSFRSNYGGNRISQHAYGNAIDINWNENPPSVTGHNTLPANVREMAEKYGLSWGADFRMSNGMRDPMHFEAYRKTQ